jgi:hypothetical protein
LGNSPCAFFTPASASFQKSEAPLTTKASCFFSCAIAPVASNAAVTSRALASLSFMNSSLVPLFVGGNAAAL